MNQEEKAKGTEENRLSEVIWERSAADVMVRKVRLRKEDVGRQKFFCWNYVMLLGMLSLSRYRSDNEVSDMRS